MAKRVELNYQVNIHEGVNNLEKSVQQIDQSLKNLKFSNNFSKDAKSQVDDLTQRIKKYKELLENLEKKAQSMGINTREELKKKQQLEALLQQLGVR